MRWLGLVCCLAFSAAGCDDSFESPERPDLYKFPYDFGIAERDGGPDLAVPDQGPMPDLRMFDHPDLTAPPDLTPVDSN